MKTSLFSHTHTLAGRIRTKGKGVTWRGRVYLALSLHFTLVVLFVNPIASSSVVAFLPKETDSQVRSPGLEAAHAVALLQVNRFVLAQWKSVRLPGRGFRVRIPKVKGLQVASYDLDPSVFTFCFVAYCHEVMCPYSPLTSPGCFSREDKSFMPSGGRL